MDTKKQQIKNEIERIKQQDDFTNREVLRGFAFSVCKYIQQFAEVGTEEYNELYCFMFEELKKISEQANKDTKDYKVYCEYKGKNTEVFCFEDRTFKERNEQEVLKRLEKRKYRNYKTNREIKNPIIIKQEISLLQ